METARRRGASAFYPYWAVVWPAADETGSQRSHPPTGHRMRCIAHAGALPAPSPTVAAREIRRAPLPTAALAAFKDDGRPPGVHREPHQDSGSHAKLAAGPPPLPAGWPDHRRVKDVALALQRVDRGDNRLLVILAQLPEPLVERRGELDLPDHPAIVRPASAA